jgi:hypothetical protein
VTTRDGKIEEIEKATIFIKSIIGIKISREVTTQSVFVVIKEGILGKIAHYGNISMNKKLGMQKLWWE